MINILKEIRDVINGFYSYKGVNDSNTRIWVNENSVIILCDKNKAGMLIGKKGNLVKQLEEMFSEIMGTSAKVHIIQNRTKISIADD